MSILLDEKSYMRFYLFCGRNGIEPAITEPAVWPVVPVPDDGCRVWSIRWNEWQGKLKYSEEACLIAALSTTNLPDVTRARTRAVEVGSRRITTLATARLPETASQSRVSRESSSPVAIDG
jgi:hypothetical protein